MPLILSNISWILLLLTPIAIADVYSAANFTSIHTVKINVHGTCCGEFLLSTKVGRLNSAHTICHYQQETRGQQASACDGQPFGVFNLNGQILEEIVGNQWNCAATHARMLTIKTTDGIDAFTLVKNTQGHYSRTQPASGTISLPVCP